MIYIAAVRTEMIGPPGGGAKEAPDISEGLFWTFKSAKQASLPELAPQEHVLLPGKQVDGAFEEEVEMRVVLTVFVLGGLMAAPASADLLVNGDFDMGSLTGWTQHAEAFPAVPPAGIITSGGVWSAGGPTSGDYMAGIGHGGNMGGGNAALYQTVSVPVGEPLTLELDVAGGIGGMNNFDGAGWWEVRVIDGAWTNPDGGALLWKHEVTAAAGANGAGFGWTHVNETFTSASGTATIVLKHGGWDPQWDWMYFGAYWDSVSLTPEPSSLILLALGLPMLRRRR
jgi:hypothetical protein